MIELVVGNRYRLILGKSRLEGSVVKSWGGDGSFEFLIDGTKEPNIFDSAVWKAVPIDPPVESRIAALPVGTLFRVAAGRNQYLRGFGNTMQTSGGGPFFSIPEFAVGLDPHAQIVKVEK